MCQAREVEQRHRLTLTSGQTGNRRADPDRELAVLGLPFWIRSRRRRFRKTPVVAQSLKRHRPSLARLHHRSADVEPDPDQPRPEAFIIAQPLETQHRNQHRLLSRVPRQIRIG